MLSACVAGLRHLQTRWLIWRSPATVTAGPGLHVGARTRLWSLRPIRIGRQVYIGKDVHIEANCRIGDYCMLANRVAFVGRRDHDHSEVGVPIRFGTWIGSRPSADPVVEEEIRVEQDVWIGFGAMVLSGVVIGRGAIVAAGSIVTRDVQPYSIVAGVPARKVGMRFENTQDIARHERMLASGTYKFSERGPQHWIVRPGADA